MYINKIIELLQKYINDYEAKKYELEVLKTKKQLYEELIPLLENKTELNDNKLFISVLLSSIYNNEEYNLEFYKAIYSYNQNDVIPLDYLDIKIKQQYKNTVEKAISLKKQLKNAYYKFSTARKVRFPLQKRKPLFDQNFTFKNIQAIISYYATMGEISEKDEVLLNNELEFYNNNIIPTQNQEKEYKTKAYNEYLDKYLLIRDYYNKITDIELNDEVESLEEPEEFDEPIDAINPRRLIFSHPASNPTKSRLIDDLKDVPEEYFERVQSLLENFLVHKKKIKSLTTNKPGFIELKDDQVRIVMKHTTNNIYCVMGVFTKKANNDRKMYRTMCNRTVTDIITKEKEKQELALGELTMQELARIVKEKARKGSR